MSFRLPPLNALRAFEVTGRRGSMSAAADELAVTPAAISHQIKVLEEFFGFPLFQLIDISVHKQAKKNEETCNTNFDIGKPAHTSDGWGILVMQKHFQIRANIEWHRLCLIIHCCDQRTDTRYHVGIIRFLNGQIVGLLNVVSGGHYEKDNT